MAKDSTFGDDNVLVHDLVTLTEAGQLLGLSAMTIWGWVEARLMRSAKIGTATVVDINEAVEVNKMMMERKASIAGRTKKVPRPVND